ncbi:FecR domain-containing protein [Cupriavidus basilensis]|uniref:FecR domain-containing protein n=1 Tax=Cupriavidus basilensis TaxID=68895 RepID=A0ABT6AQF9_9BURK|nr:FecR domain-containing protein [Cupriavidus basilensis]MDF3834861.1 FecR domain-containing protein [Cupriavidus basilensis]
MESMQRFDTAASRKNGIASRTLVCRMAGAVGALGTFGVVGILGMAGAGWPGHAAAQAAGAEGSNFIYLVRPGDTLIGLAERFMDRPGRWRELQVLNKVEDPYRLPPGMRLRIPLAHIPVIDGTARVVFVTGQARADGRALQAGVELGEGARIETGAGATVTMELGDGSRVTLPPASTIEVRRLRAFSRTGLTDAVIGIGQGEVDSRVAPRGTGVGRFEIHTPSLVTGVRGTRFRVGTEDGASQSAVLEGKVQARSRRGQQAAVRAGYGISVSSAGMLAQPVTLLPAPVLAPLPRPLLGSHAVVSWSPVAHAVGYRVVVARDAVQTELLSSQTVSGAQATLQDLPEGDLYVGVSALDARQLGGAGTVMPFTVRLNPPAPFTLVPERDGTAYGETVTFTWAEVASAAQYELEVAADADFGQGLVQARDAAPMASQALAPGRWWWRVRSLDATGQPGPWGEPVAFAVEPSPPQPRLEDDGGDTLRIAWPATAAAAGTVQAYRLQMASDDGFTHIVSEVRSETSEARLPRPGSGIYFVRVAREGKPGVPPHFSAPQRIEVMQYVRDSQGQAIGAGGRLLNRGN